MTFSKFFYIVQAMIGILGMIAAESIEGKIVCFGWAYSCYRLLQLVDINAELIEMVKKLGGYVPEEYL